MRSFTLPVLAALATVAAGCAPAGGPPSPMSASASASASARQCFSQTQVTNFRQGQDQKIYLRMLNRGVFELQSGGCDLGLANAIQISLEHGGSSRVCTDDTVRILNDGGDLVNIPCRARITRTLTPAEVEALPSRDRP